MIQKQKMGIPLIILVVLAVLAKEIPLPADGWQTRSDAATVLRTGTI